MVGYRLGGKGAFASGFARTDLYEREASIHCVRESKSFHKQKLVEQQSLIFVTALYSLLSILVHRTHECRAGSFDLTS